MASAIGEYSSSHLCFKDSSRYRWAKISQAMSGRRTPRQVASRVQKYFEKLKRFGVGVEKKSKPSSRS
jgi:hypothetical protein